MPLGAFQQRLDGIEKSLSPLGEVELEDLSTAHGRRSIALRVDAPGYGLPTRAVFEYRERYRRIAQGWLRDLYAYEYRPQPPPSRRAHHDHEPHGIHQHCREALRLEASSHYEDRPRLLEETHEAFERLYVDEIPIDCAGLRPISQRPDSRRGESS